LRDVLREHDENRRIELADGGLLIVINDFAFDRSDPSEVATLWCFAAANVLITVRLHPLRSADELRLQLRNGSSVASGFELLCLLLDTRTGRLKGLATEMTAQSSVECADRAGAAAIEHGSHGVRHRRDC